MLVGTIKYKVGLRDDLAPKYENFEFEGVDSSTCLYGRLRTHSYRAIGIMAGVQDSDSLWERRLNINLSSVKVEVETYLDKTTGKRMKKPVNYDFFCKLGALIRYAKSKCQKKNALGYTGLKLASGEYVPESEITYIIPLDKKNSNDADVNLGTVVLCLGEIKELHIHTDEFIIDIEEDKSREMTVFYDIKNSTPKGFKFDEETLGFYIAPQVVEKVSSNNGMYTCLEDIIKNNPEKEYSWLLNNKYIIVSDDMLEEVCEYIRNWDGFVYYDTETTGLNITFKSRIGQADQLVGVVLSVKFGESFFFPCQMKSIPNLCNGDHWYFMEHYMRPILEGKKLVAHNMSYDWKVAYIYDINANIVHDTMALFKLTLDAEKENFPMGLKELAKMFLNRDSLELSDLVIDDSWGESDIKFWDLPYELVRLYACADTDNTKGLLDYALSNDLLAQYNATRVYEIEIAFSFAVAYQEFMGHKIDSDNLEGLRADVEAGIKENMDKMVEIVGYEFNPNSPSQLLKIMYDPVEQGGQGIPPQISRKTGRPTTDKETLKYLSELTDIEGNVKYPFVKYLQDYRTYEGVRKIIDQFPDLATEDGYLFSSVMQYGTTTGRVSINKPNYQSYNNTVKKYVVPRPGFYMTDSDYSSVEYRVLGNMSGNTMIKEGFKDPDFDYHAYQAARMYNVPYAAVTKKLRKAAKGINFGLPYGMGDESLGVRVFGEASQENTRKAAALRQKYFEGQEDIRDFFETARANGVNNGYTETYFGRRRYYHRNKFSVNAIRRQAGNQVIQGCVSGETRIQTCEFGIVKLKDVAGLNVLVWNGERWSNGDVLYSGKKHKCIVKFKGGQEFICSPQHKFLVVDNHGREHWVEAKDLKFGYKSSANNSHVRVNNSYEPSDYEYTSKDAYVYKTDNHQSNNALLEDIESSFDRGVVLGRLASDGSYCIRDDDGSYITQFVAEHEFNILPELRTCMEALGYSENNPDVRENRNEKVKRLSVYSSSLAHEITDLDIKHQVHDNIFMDTEMLRGFLSGFFDGDGGISGKTISLVFGTQYDFEPMCLDLQKALLFFGVRSRYHKYDDRHVIQIKTNDNPQFLDLIGFLNQDKQDAGRKLVCKEQETTFGKCIVVESVEITDELIDMYDVCNTDDGYYVADGIITHNTAADIYKLAVGRLFKRICKEGWLGKVLLIGFIHDEVLCEVHNSIDPMVWLKTLREEFEVKIEGWCPLYMGFGFGMSWYEAKSVELPIKLQWELVNKYGETGYPKWHGNGYELCAEVPEILRDFSVRDTEMQLLDEESQGKVIKPTLNNAMFDVLSDDKSDYERVINDYEASNFNEVNALGEEEFLEMNEGGLLAELEKYHIKGLYRKDGKIQTTFEKTKDTQQAIDDFCQLHALDRSKINLENIPDAGSVMQTEGSDNVNYDDAYDEESVFDKQRAIDTRIDTFGLYLDVDEKEVLLRVVPNNYMQFIRQHANTEGKGYKIKFKDCEKKLWLETKCYLESEDINIIQEMYIKYFTSLSRQ